jgi:hypothetical protein
MLDAELFLQPHIIPYKEHTLHQLQSSFSALPHTSQKSVSPHIYYSHGNTGMTSPATVSIITNTKDEVLLLLLLLTEIELSFGDSSPYTNTDKTNKNKYT